MSKFENSPHKWVFGDSAKTWWDALTLERQQFYKKHYETICTKNLKSKYPYPDMYDTTKLRIAQLGQKHIYRIWVFRDHKI